MYDGRQFKVALYLLLLLGVAGYSLATEAPVLWFLTTSAILFNAWLVKTGRFVPMPRLWSNVLTIGTIVVVVFMLRSLEILPILLISQFIVALQLIKLYEQRENRDYAQLLVLNLLLMVAAAISTASLLFGITFIIYLFISLYCSLLFHLKSETDRARVTYGQPVDKINPVTFRQDQRYLPRSMRRLTALISVASVVTGVLVFFLFPRRATERMFTPVQMRTIQPLTGFNDRVSFQKVAQITQSNDVVARVEAYYRNQKVVVPFPLLLRGSALDRYSGDDTKRGRWQWSRSPWFNYGDQDSFQLDSGETEHFWPGNDKNYEDDYSTNYRLVINLDPTGTNKLFTMAGISSITPVHPLRLHFFRHDSILESVDPLNQPIQYSIVCNNRLIAIDSPYRQYGVEWRSSSIDPMIAKLARQADVCGGDNSGKSLADAALGNDRSFDAIIAKNIETYLRIHYQYTLDLTNEATWGQRDPIVGFLYDFKKGHCEYFAGAMTLMCQSLGIPARMVVGFKCDAEDFNTLGDYYAVKQSNAHAWCEVYTGTEWQTYDPTTSIGATTPAQRAQSYASRWLKLFDYLEFKWATSVIAYSPADNRSFTEAANLRLTNTAVSSSARIGAWTQKFRDWWDGIQLTVSSVVLGISPGVVAMGFFAAVSWFLWERWRLRRRARRIGLETSRGQMQLVRNLEFYDDLIRLLERRNIVRAKHLTPMEFSRNLSFLPNTLYNDIRRLTELFYRVRYGEAELNAYRQRRLVTVVQRIGRAMDSPTISFS